MGFRYNRRINLGKGLGINVSKSGISPSYRSKGGSIGSRGYSVRTGIPGLTYRKSFSKSKNSGCLVSMLLFLVLIAMLWSCESEGCTAKTNCSDYSSQASAQSAFDLDPQCRDNLDRDNDGIACEELAD